MIKKFLFARSNNLVVIGLSVALGAAVATHWGRDNAQAQTAARRTLPPEQKATLRNLQDAFANIAENAEPFVVTINARPNPAQRPESENDRSDRGRRAPRVFRDDDEQDGPNAPG